MVLNHDQREYSKLFIRDSLSFVLKDGDLQRMKEMIEMLFNKHRMRMDIYYDLKVILERDYDIDTKILYGVILKDIYMFFQTGLDHLDMFCPTDLDLPRDQS